MPFDKNGRWIPPQGLGLKPSGGGSTTPSSPAPSPANAPLINSIVSESKRLETQHKQEAAKPAPKPPATKPLPPLDIVKNVNNTITGAQNLVKPTTDVVEYPHNNMPKNTAMDRLKAKGPAFPNEPAAPATPAWMQPKDPKKEAALKQQKSFDDQENEMKGMALFIDNYTNGQKAGQQGHTYLPEGPDGSYATALEVVKGKIKTAASSGNIDMLQKALDEDKQLRGNIANTYGKVPMIMNDTSKTPAWQTALANAKRAGKNIDEFGANTMQGFLQGTGMDSVAQMLGAPDTDKLAADYADYARNYDPHLGNPNGQTFDMLSPTDYFRFGGKDGKKYHLSETEQSDILAKSGVGPKYISKTAAAGANLTGNVIGMGATLVGGGGAAAGKLTGEMAAKLLAERAPGWLAKGVTGFISGTTALGLYQTELETAQEVADPSKQDFMGHLKDVGGMAMYGASYGVAEPLAAKIMEKIGHHLPGAVQSGLESLGNKLPRVANAVHDVTEGMVSGGIVGTGMATGMLVQGAANGESWKQMTTEMKSEMAERFVESISYALARRSGEYSGHLEYDPIHSINQRVVNYLPAEVQDAYHEAISDAQKQGIDPEVAHNIVMDKLMAVPEFAPIVHQAVADEAESFAQSQILTQPQDANAIAQATVHEEQQTLDLSQPEQPIQPAQATHGESQSWMKENHSNFNPSHTVDGRPVETKAHDDMTYYRFGDGTGGVTGIADNLVPINNAPAEQPTPTVPQTQQDKNLETLSNFFGGASDTTKGEGPSADKVANTFLKSFGNDPAKAHANAVEMLKDETPGTPMHDSMSAAVNILAEQAGLNKRGPVDNPQPGMVVGVAGRQGKFTIKNVDKKGMTTLASEHGAEMTIHRMNLHTLPQTEVSSPAPTAQPNVTNLNDKRAEKEAAKPVEGDHALTDDDAYFEGSVKVSELAHKVSALKKKNHPANSAYVQDLAAAINLFNRKDEKDKEYFLSLTDGNTTDYTEKLAKDKIFRKVFEEKTGTTLPEGKEAIHQYIAQAFDAKTNKNNVPTVMVDDTATPAPKAEKPKETKPAEQPKAENPLDALNKAERLHKEANKKINEAIKNNDPAALEEAKKLKAEAKGILEKLKEQAMKEGFVPRDEQAKETNSVGQQEHNADILKPKPGDVVTIWHGSYSPEGNINREQLTVIKKSKGKYYTVERPNGEQTAIHEVAIKDIISGPSMKNPNPRKNREDYLAPGLTNEEIASLLGDVTLMPFYSHKDGKVTEYPALPELASIDDADNLPNNNIFNKLFFAVSPNDTELDAIRAAAKEGNARNLLLSYGTWAPGHQPRAKDREIPVPEFLDGAFPNGDRPTIIIDNGAYSGISTGTWEVLDFFAEKGISAKDAYAFVNSKEAESFAKSHPQFEAFHKWMTWLESIKSHIDYVITPDSMDTSIDVEQRQRASNFAYEFFQESGINFIPVYQYNADHSHIDDLIKMGADYIAIGGTVHNPELKKDADRAEYVNAIVEKYPKVKFHLLGTNDEWIIERVNGLYSADGGRWVMNAAEKTAKQKEAEGLSDKEATQRRVENLTEEVKTREAAVEDRKEKPFQKFQTQGNNRFLAKAWSFLGPGMNGKGSPQMKKIQDAMNEYGPIAAYRAASNYLNDVDAERLKKYLPGVNWRAEKWAEDVEGKSGELTKALDAHEGPTLAQAIEVAQKTLEGTMKDHDRMVTTQFVKKYDAIVKKQQAKQTPAEREMEQLQAWQQEKVADFKPTHIFMNRAVQIQDAPLNGRIGIRFGNGDGTFIKEGGPEQKFLEPFTKESAEKLKERLKYDLSKLRVVQHDTVESFYNASDRRKEDVETALAFAKPGDGIHLSPELKELPELRQKIAVSHEMGHFIFDEMKPDQSMKNEWEAASRLIRPKSWASVNTKNKTMPKLTIDGKVKEVSVQEYKDYLAKPTELFADAFALYQTDNAKARKVMPKTSKYFDDVLSGHRDFMDDVMKSVAEEVPPAKGEDNKEVADATESKTNYLDDVPEPKKLPPVGDNYLRPVSDFADRIYHESSGEYGLWFLPNGPTVSAMADLDYFFANTPNLAHGQASNKGVVVELSTNGLQGRVNRNKPGLGFAYENGEAELVLKLNSQKTYRDNLISVTVKHDRTDAIFSKAHKSQFKMLVKGWKTINNADGSTTYINPANEAVAPIAAKPAETPTVHRYYLKLRPPGPGTHPSGTVNVVSFDERKHVDGVGQAWGYVEYNKPIADAAGWDMVAAPTVAKPEDVQEVANSIMYQHVEGNIYPREAYDTAVESVLDEGATRPTFDEVMAHFETRLSELNAMSDPDVAEQDERKYIMSLLGDKDKTGKQSGNPQTSKTISDFVKDNPQPKPNLKKGSFVLLDGIGVGKVDGVYDDGDITIEIAGQKYYGRNVKDAEVRAATEEDYIAFLRDMVDHLSQQSKDKRKEAADFNKSTGGEATNRKGKVQLTADGTNYIPVENFNSRHHSGLLGDAKKAKELKDKFQVEIKFYEERQKYKLPAPKPEEKPAPKQVTVTTQKPFHEMTTDELVAFVKAEEPNPQIGYGLFVKYRSLKPEIGAKEFNAIFANVSGNRQVTRTTTDFNPTHQRELGGHVQQVQTTKQEDGRISWVSDKGATGTDPEAFFNKTFTPIEPPAPPSEPPSGNEPPTPPNDSTPWEQVKGLTINDLEEAAKKFKESQKSVVIELHKLPEYKAWQQANRDFNGAKNIVDDIMKRKPSKTRDKDVAKPQRHLDMMRLAKEKADRALKQAFFEKLAADESLHPAQRDFAKAMIHDLQSYKDAARQKFGEAIQKLAEERGLSPFVAKILGEHVGQDPIHQGVDSAFTDLERYGHSTFGTPDLETSIANVLEDQHNRRSLFQHIVGRAAQETAAGSEAENKQMYYTVLNAVHQANTNQSAEEAALNIIRHQMKVYKRSIGEYASEINNYTGEKTQQEALKELTRTIGYWQEYRKALHFLTGEQSVDLEPFLQHVKWFVSISGQREQGLKARDGNTVILDPHEPLKPYPKKVTQLLDKGAFEKGLNMRGATVDGVQYVTDRHSLLPVTGEDKLRIDEKRAKAGLEPLSYDDASGQMERLLRADHYRDQKPLPAVPDGISKKSSNEPVAFFNIDGKWVTIKQKYVDYAKANGLTLYHNPAKPMDAFTFRSQAGNVVGMASPVNVQNVSAVLKAGEHIPEMPDLVKPPNFEEYMQHGALPEDVQKAMEETGAFFSPPDPNIPVEIQHPNPAVEAIIRKNRAVPKEQAMAKMRGYFETFRNRITREFEHLPKTKEFENLRQKLLQLTSSKDAAKHKTLTIIIADIVRPLNKNEFQLFERKILAMDMLEDFDRGIALKLGQTLQELNDWIAKLDQEIQNSPKVKVALDKRKEAWDKLKDEYFTAMDAIGFHMRDHLDRENYFRHIVLSHANDKVSSYRKKLRTPKSGFTNAREEDATDAEYLTNYLESENEVMVQFMYDIDKARVIKLVDDKYNILDNLKKDAAKANEDALHELFDAEKNAPNAQLNSSGKPFSRKEFDYNNLLKVGTAKEINDFIKDALGKNFKAWKDMLKQYPGYGVWQPMEGSIFFKKDLSADLDDMFVTWAQAMKVPQHEIDNFVNDLNDKLGGPVLAVGQKRREFVLPLEVIATLDNLVDEKKRHEVAVMVRYVTGMFKRYVLYAPHRTVKYNLRNFSSDLEKSIAGNPKGLMRWPQAMRELAGVFLKESKGTPELQEFIHRGGMLNLQQVQETGDIGLLKQYMRLYDENKSMFEKMVKSPVTAVQFYWRWVRKLTDLREASFRYAHYLEYLHQMEKNGGKPSNYGASRPALVDGLDDVRDRAFKLSAELMVDYRATSAFGQDLSDTGTYPFFRWVEGNFKSTTGLFRNAMYDGKLAQTLGQKILGKVAVSPIIAYRLGMLAMRLAFLQFLLQMWNEKMFPEQEKQLSDDQRSKMHFIYGEWGGKTRVIDRLGFMEDYMEWFGLGNPIADTRAILDGEKTLHQVAMEEKSKVANKIMQGVAPVGMAGIESATGLSFYPDFFSPKRSNLPWFAPILDLTSFYNEYDTIRKHFQGVPSKPYDFSNTFSVGSDPGEAAYYQLRDWATSYKQQHGIAIGSAAPNDRSDALYYFKLAMRLGDEAAMQKYLTKYVMNGGTNAGIDASLKSLDPLYGLTNDDKGLFLSKLDKRQLDVFDRAMQFYGNVLFGPGK